MTGLCAFRPNPTVKCFDPEPETLYEKGNQWLGGWSLNPNDLHLLLFTGNYKNSAGHVLYYIYGDVLE